MPFSIGLSGELAMFDAVPGICASAVEGLRRAAATRSETDVLVLVGDDALERARPAWRAIERAGGAPTAFQALDLAEATLSAHRARGERPRIIVVHEDGQPLVVLPAVVGRLMSLRAIRFLGDPLIQYGDALAAPEAEPRHLRMAWCALADAGAADMALLRKVRADAHLAPVLDAVAPTAEQGAPYVDLRDPEAGADPKPRDLARLRRRLAEIGEPRLEVHKGADACRYLAHALEMKRAWLAERGIGSAVIGDAFWEAALLETCRSRASAASARAAVLYCGDTLAAIEFGFVHDGTWHAYIGAVAPELARCGPGRVQMAELMARCRRDGLVAYDLMAPADRYKRGLASGIVPVRDYVAPLRWRGRVASGAANFALAVKAQAPRLGAGLHRLLPALLGWRR